jgi:hypothetical protein
VQVPRGQRPKIPEPSAHASYLASWAAPASASSRVGVSAGPHIRVDLGKGWPGGCPRSSSSTAPRLLGSWTLEGRGCSLTRLPDRCVRSFAAELVSLSLRRSSRRLSRLLPPGPAHARTPPPRTPLRPPRPRSRRLHDSVAAFDSPRSSSRTLVGCRDSALVADDLADQLRPLSLSLSLSLCPSQARTSFSPRALWNLMKVQRRENFVL